MRKLIRLFASVMLVSMIGRLILMKKAGPEGVQKMFMDVMPKVMDSAFAKLQPEKRQQMLAHCHAMIAGLDAKYGEPTAAPSFEERLAA